MPNDEPFAEHLSLQMLWEVRTKTRLFTDEEVAHFLGCDRCICVWGICQVSQSLEQAERRLKEQGPK
jgi:hypothetical protein